MKTPAYYVALLHVAAMAYENQLEAAGINGDLDAHPLPTVDSLVAEVEFHLDGDSDGEYVAKKSRRYCTPRNIRLAAEEVVNALPAKQMLLAHPNFTEEQVAAELALWAKWEKRAKGEAVDFREPCPKCGLINSHRYPCTNDGAPRPMTLGEEFEAIKPEEPKAEVSERTVKIGEIAATFVRVLGNWLSEEEMAEVRRRNALEVDKNVCHTHDFCDANAAMEKAFAEVLGDKVDIFSEEGLALWNKAWEGAKPSLSITHREWAIRSLVGDTTVAQWMVLRELSTGPCYTNGHQFETLVDPQTTIKVLMERGLVSSPMGQPGLVELTNLGREVLTRIIAK